MAIKKQTVKNTMTVSLDYKGVNYFYKKSDEESVADFRIRVQIDLDKEKVPVLCQ